jgi:hypothetical protein
MITGAAVFELEARLWRCSEEADEREHIEGEGETKTSSALRFPRTWVGRQTRAEADMAYVGKKFDLIWLIGCVYFWLPSGQPGPVVSQGMPIATIISLCCLPDGRL